MNGLLKFITCGSVDDGKSTLIGHILYDSKLLYADQEKALELDSKVGSRGGEIDYSLLLDGLMAEREQGITIDVAYRYFTTEHRSFIVADTPGHEEYTRNMAVGASFADLAVILIDAKQGVLVQTRRHARICALMGIRYFIFAVNKMDLVDYSEEVFEKIREQTEELKAELGLADTWVIPVSATEGDNVTEKSSNTPWYQGPALLTYLEQVDVSSREEEKGFYLPVQRVCRPDHSFRGFQGQIEAGELSEGDEVTALPSKETAHVKSIYIADRECSKAGKGFPVTVQLDREVDVSRGCVLEKDSGAKVTSELTATLLWMDDETLENSKNFFVKLGTQLIPGTVSTIRYAIDVNTGEEKPAGNLKKNEIASCRITLVDRIVADEFKKHKTLGELILIDRVTNMTSACGVVTEIAEKKEKADNTMRFQTKLLHGAGAGRYQDGGTLPPISQANAFSYDTPEELEKVFQNRAPGYAYSRIANPTVDAFEKRICKLEGGIGAVACSSGMSAVTLSLLNILRAGDELIAGSTLFGGTLDLFRDLEAFGIKIRFIPEITPRLIGPLLSEKTKAVFGEVIGNPGLNVMDIEETAAFLHEKGIPLIVDSTTATPYLVNPISLGADIVVHSSSKYINGGGNAISGIIIDSGHFPWNPQRYPGMEEYCKYGRFAYLMKLRSGIWRNMGGCLAPMNAYLNIVGMETLGLRMERICQNALELAETLSRQKGISVNYPLLCGSPWKEIAEKQLNGRGGGIFTLRAGSKERAYRLLNSLKYAKIATNIGDIRTLVIHPESTIYLHSSQEVKEAAGIYDDLIRVSVGIEDIEDLKADFVNAVSGL